MMIMMMMTMTMMFGRKKARETPATLFILCLTF